MNTFFFLIVHRNDRLRSPTLPAAQERQSRPADQRPVRGERSAAEEPGDHGAAAEDRREEELPAGGEDLQPEQDRA